ncbi:hypothetical protein PC116_g34408 [Phytophthora cactorum]|nr:hypothetical protein PC116_g34408 [Phytophthora cactorum]
MTFKQEKESDTEADSWTARVSSKPWLEVNELDYKFPREFWKILPTLRSPEFQNSIVVNMSLSLAQTRKEIRERVYDMLELVATDLSERVREATEKLASEKAIISRGEIGSWKL